MCVVCIIRFVSYHFLLCACFDFQFIYILYIVTLLLFDQSFEVCFFCLFLFFSKQFTFFFYIFYVYNVILCTLKCVHLCFFCCSALLILFCARLFDLVWFEFCSTCLFVVFLGNVKNAHVDLFGPFVLLTYIIHILHFYYSCLFFCQLIVALVRCVKFVIGSMFCFLIYFILRRLCVTLYILNEIEYIKCCEYILFCLLLD